MTVQLPAVLATGLDTLHAGVFCALRSDLFREFEGRVLDAKELQGLAEYAIGPHVHRLFRGGGGWKWMLVLPQFWTVRLAHRSSGDPAPQMNIQLRSPLLWADGASRALELALSVLVPALCVGDAREVQASRVDLTMDWCEWEPRDEELRDVVRRPRFMAARYEPSFTARQQLRAALEREILRSLRDADGQLPLEAVASRAASAGLASFRRSAAGAALAVADAAADDQASFESYWSGRTYTGAVWGRGDAQAKAYRKDIEIRQSSGKTWFFDVWVGSGGGTFVPGEREQAIRDLESKPIWRLEFQLRREALKSWGLDTMDQVWPALPALWRELVGGWITMREPRISSRTGKPIQRTRWPLRKEWAALRDGWRAEVSIPLLRKRIRQISYERSRALATLAAARAFALVAHRLPVGALHDPSDAAPALAEMLVEELEERDTSWTELVEGYHAAAERPGALPDPFAAVS